jgi:hypothetical protein
MRSSVKEKRIHNRFKGGTHSGRFGGDVIVSRLYVGLPQGLNDFLTAQSTQTKTAKAQLIRERLALWKEAIDGGSD